MSHRLCCAYKTHSQCKMKAGQYLKGYIKLSHTKKGTEGNPSVLTQKAAYEVTDPLIYLMHPQTSK